VPDLAVVVVERLKVLVDVSNGASEAQVEGPENTNIPTRKHRTPISICQLKEDKGLLNCSSWENTTQKKGRNKFPYKNRGEGSRSVPLVILDELDGNVLVWLDLGSATS